MVAIPRRGGVVPTWFNFPGLKRLVAVTHTGLPAFCWQLPPKLMKIPAAATHHKNRLMRCICLNVDTSHKIAYKCPIQKNQGDWCDQVVLAWLSPSNGVVCWQLPTFPTWNEQFLNSWRRSAFRWPVRVVSLPKRPRLKHIETLPAASRPQNPSAEGPLKHSTRKLSRHKELPLEVFACLSRLSLGRDFVRIRKLRGFSC